VVGRLGSFWMSRPRVAPADAATPSATARKVFRRSVAVTPMTLAAVREPTPELGVAPCTSQPSSVTPAPVMTIPIALSKRSGVGLAVAGSVQVAGS